MCLTTGPGAGQGSISSLHLPRIPVPIPWLSGVSRGGERVCSQEDRGWAHPSGRSSSSGQGSGASTAVGVMITVEGGGQR